MGEAVPSVQAIPSAAAPCAPRSTSAHPRVDNPLDLKTTQCILDSYDLSSSREARLDAWNHLVNICLNNIGNNKKRKPLFLLDTTPHYTRIPSLRESDEGRTPRRDDHRSRGRERIEILLAEALAPYPTWEQLVEAAKQGKFDFIVKRIHDRFISEIRTQATRTRNDETDAMERALVSLDATSGDDEGNTVGFREIVADAEGRNFDPSKDPNDLLQRVEENRSDLERVIGKCAADDWVEVIHAARESTRTNGWVAAFAKRVGIQPRQARNRLAALYLAIAQNCDDPIIRELALVCSPPVPRLLTKEKPAQKRIREVCKAAREDMAAFKRELLNPLAPCPCGSKKEYKNCCLPTVVPSAWEKKLQNDRAEAEQEDEGKETEYRLFFRLLS